MSCNKKTPCGCCKKKTSRPRSLLFFLLALFGGTLLVLFNLFEDQESEAFQAESLGMVLLLGFLTGLHCIGMCGGIVTVYLRYGKQNDIPPWRSHLQYGLAKTLSYALFGALFGLLGSIVHFSNDLKSSVSILGGLFLLYLGARSFGLLRPLPILNKLGYSRLRLHRLSNPLIVGLLNGLMISCAPLQALYLVAAGLGDPIYGAIMLAVFSLGTLPIFMFYGVILSSFNRLQSIWADRITTAIIVVYGVLMVNRGMALGGYSLSLLNPGVGVEPTTMNTSIQTLSMNADSKGWSKDEIYFEVGRKIRWEIQVDELTVCNRTIEVPALDIKRDLQPGLNVIEFDPGNHQTLVYTCWMGMLTGEFVAQ